MTFSKFSLTELDDDAENDYQVDLITGNSRHGFCVTEAELAMLSDGFDDALAGASSDIDGRTAADYAEGDA